MERNCHRLVFALCLILASGSSALAEDLSELQPGTRIRATYLEHYHGKTRTRKITGKIAELTDCTLSLFGRPIDEVEFLPRENITRLERSIHPSRQGKGLTRGFVLGASIGVLTSIVVSGRESQSGDYVGEYAVLIGLCAMAGTALGALFGLSTAHGEEWEEIDLSPITLSFDAEPVNGSRLLVGFRF